MYIHQLIYLAKEEKLKGKNFTKKNHILPSHVSFKLCYPTLLCFSGNKTPTKQNSKALLDLVRIF